MTKVKGFEGTQEHLKNLIIFTDPGIDDAIAINELIREVPSNTYIYLCPVEGNCDSNITFINATKPATSRVTAIIDTRSLDTTETTLVSSYAGRDGLGDCEYYKNVKKK